MYLKTLKNSTFTTLLNSIFADMVNYDYVPTNYVGNTTTETGKDENGYNWVKNTFTSNDGNYTQTTYYKTKTNDTTVPNLFNFDFNFDFDGTDYPSTTKKADKNTLAGKSYTNRLELLNNELELAIKNQKFEEAVRLRDEINQINNTNTELTTLKTNLETLITEQNFEQAITVRDRIKELEATTATKTTNTTNTTKTTKK
jgi:hypothetical protein